MIKQQLDRFNRLNLLGGATALEKLERLSAWLGRDIYVKRDDTTPLAMGGNKLRKLEYLAADALAQGADTLITAGAIQSNHVRQTAALAAKLGLGCVALLENPTGTDDPNYLGNGNRLLVELFDAKVELVENLDNADEQLQGLAERTAQLLGVAVPDAFNVILWDEYFAPRYGEPNAGTLAAIKLLASQEGLLLDPVYTGKAMAGLLDGIGRQAFAEGPIIFLHTGGAPALFAYDSVF